MGLITRATKVVTNPGSTAFSGGTPDAGEFNADLNIAYNEINGNLETINIADSTFDNTLFKTTGVLPIQRGGLDTTTGVRTFLGGNFRGATIAASTTKYAAPFATPTTTEANQVYPVPFAGRAGNLYVRLASAQPSSGSLVITLRKDQVDTAVTITIAAGTAVSTVSDLTNTVTFTVGQLLSVSFVNNATDASGFLAGWSLEYVPT